MIGYGSYGTWIYAESVAEYDAAPEEYKNLQKNINLRQCLVEHDGHDFVIWSNDWASVFDGALVIDLTDEVSIPDFSQYKQINL